MFVVLYYGMMMGLPVYGDGYQFIKYQYFHKIRFGIY